MDFEYVAGEFAHQVTTTTNITEAGVIFVAENVRDYCTAADGEMSDSIDFYWKKNLFASMN